MPQAARGSRRTLGIQNMQLTSVDKRTTIDIRQANPKDPHSAYILELKFSVPLAISSGKTKASISKVAEFKPAFEKFLRVREGSVVLDATEDCRFEFFSWNAKGDVGLQYTIGKYVYEGEPPLPCPVTVSGRFKLHGEFQ